ncbi:MAG: lipopolysaccharide transport periplasmic protein LptA, partial [Gammaproteobacteria bacterium]|nr:lipopolysaccharide transport periplasmic protein LptA [Gammaproteobacteria bacterium]
MKPRDSTLLPLGCFLLGLTVTPAAHAAGDDADEPIRINARSVEANEKTGTAVYRGHVVAEQGRLSIRADRVEIRARDNQTELIQAIGSPVKLRQQPDATTEEIQAEARRVDYHVLSGKLDMIGDVSLRRGDDLFTGSVLHYDLDTRSLSATGDDRSDGRVHAVIQPRKPTPPA